MTQISTFVSYMLVNCYLNFWLEFCNTFVASAGWVPKDEKKEGSGGGAHQPLLQPQQATPTQPQQAHQQVAAKVACFIFYCTKALIKH